VSFFAPLDPPPPSSRPQRRPAQPPWIERPRGVLLGGVAHELVLARTPDVAVGLTHIGACGDGFAATLLVLAATDSDDPDEAPFGWGPWRGRTDPERRLRFGVRYGDGGVAELDGAGAGPRSRGERPRGDDPPEGPVIHGQGGGGGGSEWRQELWFWPLPPEGPLTFAVQWLARGVAETLQEWEAAPIRDAAARAQTLFAPGELPGSPGSFRVSPMHLFKDPPGPS
jgi:hypothetical protein